MKYVDWFWHRVCGRPYRLHCRLDQGNGSKTVVFLHGIASSGENWRHMYQHFEGQQVHIVVLDLLGFGDSPKPEGSWVTYDVSDQARAVLYTLAKLRVRGPVLLVGHSMGCLVSIGVAQQQPDLVRGLMLYEPPFYVGLPKHSPHTRRLKAYFKLYNSMIDRVPVVLRHAWPMKMFSTLTGFSLTAETWVPFERSMRNVIMRYDGIATLKSLKAPTKIFYGRFDALVFNDKPNVFFGPSAKHISVMQVPEAHMISARGSKVLAQEILAALKTLR